MTNVAKLEHIIYIARQYENAVTARQSRAQIVAMLSMHDSINTEPTEEITLESVAKDMLTRISGALEIPVDNTEES